MRLNTTSAIKARAMQIVVILAVPGSYRFYHLYYELDRWSTVWQKFGSSEKQ